MAGRSQTRTICALGALAGASALAVRLLQSAAEPPAFLPALALQSRGAQATVARRLAAKAEGPKSHSAPGAALSGCALAGVAMVAAFATSVRDRAKVAAHERLAQKLKRPGAFRSVPKWTDPRRADVQRGSPHQVPVIDMQGNQVGEETAHFRTFKKDAANYVVHQVITIWQYQQKPFTTFVPRRSDIKKGKKPYAQKGGGKARHGSRYSPIFGKAATNKAPHGLDNKRDLKIRNYDHYTAISTVLQSKWRCIKIVDGIEGWDQFKQKPLEAAIRSWTDVELGEKTMLLITRHGYGRGYETCSNLPNPSSMENPLYMSGRLIPKLHMRRPVDLDPKGDGLYQVLNARRIFISREAFFDLMAKYGAEDGWSQKKPQQILVENLRTLAEMFPYDRAAEFDAARKLPKLESERQAWAAEMRAKMALEKAS